MTQLSSIPKTQRKEYASGDLIGGKYGLVRRLGEGGMGSVWVAENMSLKANVALKLIRADVAEASANERFLSEARLAARLQHAAIVRVFDFGKTEHDEPYIVMELLQGETLGQRLGRHGAIDPVELCQTLLPIIDALHSAHGHGVIHRDLKPDNVFVAKTEGGGVQPKLLDFGIAKLRGEGAFHSTKLTQAGTLIGSPDYMSPEQARGETDLDPRSDVWALCVLAYECLVGKPPFHGDNYNALLWAIIHDEPVPITVFQAGDAELWRILKTGFAKDRNQRWESARKLGEALAAWLESHGILEDVCNRSLQSSWLPAERPTRPELAPFDPHAPGLPQRRPSPSHDSIIPPPTLAALRRPHTMSMWFAGLGTLTLLAALFLSKLRSDAIPTVDASRHRQEDRQESGRQKIGSLLPGPAPETREPGVESDTLPSGIAPAGEPPEGVTLEGLSPEAQPQTSVQRTALGRSALPSADSPRADVSRADSSRAKGAMRGPTGMRTLDTSDPGGLAPSGSARAARPLPANDDPIALPLPERRGESNSWKANRDRAAQSREVALADEVDDGLRGVRAGDRNSAATAADKKRAAKAKASADASARPRPARASAKKTSDKTSTDTEVDFGI